jgi:hypothetical protein
VTPTPQCEVTWEKLNFRTIPGYGGIGHFHLATKNCQGKVIQLKIERTNGLEGSAVFVESNAVTLNVVADVDRIVKVRGIIPSDVAYNMRASATNPVTLVKISTDFVVFWTEPTGVVTGSVPVEATGAEGPIGNIVKALRTDGENLLGIGFDRLRGSERGFEMMEWKMWPDELSPFDFRSGGPGDGFDAKRLRTYRLYADGCVIEAVDRQLESSAAAMKSLIPSFETDGLKIFDVDAPSSARPQPGIVAKDFIRSRANFIAWPVYTDDDGVDRKVAVEYRWFFRGSFDVKAGKWLGAPGDNKVAAPGQTQLTYDLNLENPIPFKITSFTPQTASNAQGTVDVVITGSFPDVPGDDCDWAAYMIATGDSLGDPDESTDDYVIRATKVVKDADTQLTATFPLYKNPTHLRGKPIPAPARKYKLRVVRSGQYREGPVPFVITENPFDHWAVDGFTSVGPPGPPPHPNVRFYVHAEDAQGNMVSRPGGSRPTITVTPGDVFLQWLTPSMGAYGEYYADGVKVTPGASGFDTVTASGGGVPDASAQVVIPK